jgi:beta-glucosidase/6-phospho-beta-glucosidase/beta-galactosidase
MTRFLTLLAFAMSLSAIYLPAHGEPKFKVGTTTHFAQAKGDLPHNIEMMQHAGIRWIRDEAYWSQIETEKGRLEMPEMYDRYVRGVAEAGLSPLMLLTYGNRFYDGGGKPISDEARAGFIRHAQFVAEHFKGLIPAYQVWNEWDIGIGTAGRVPGTPPDYVKLLSEVYPALKEIDPDVLCYAHFGPHYVGDDAEADRARDGHPTRRC